MAIEITTDSEALNSYFEAHDEKGLVVTVPSDVEAIAGGWVVYNGNGPLALVEDGGEVRFLSDEEWEPLQAEFGGNW